MVSIGPNLGKQIKDMGKLVHVDTQKPAVQAGQTSETKSAAKPKPTVIPGSPAVKADEIAANYNKAFISLSTAEEAKPATGETTAKLKGNGSRNRPYTFQDLMDIDKGGHYPTGPVWAEYGTNNQVIQVEFYYDMNTGGVCVRPAWGAV